MHRTADIKMASVGEGDGGAGARDRLLDAMTQEVLNQYELDRKRAEVAEARLEGVRAEAEARRAGCTADEARDEVRRTLVALEEERDALSALRESRFPARASRVVSWHLFPERDARAPDERD